jgi:hypothetical protein
MKPIWCGKTYHRFAEICIGELYANGLVDKKDIGVEVP